MNTALLVIAVGEALLYAYMSTGTHVQATGTWNTFEWGRLLERNGLLYVLVTGTPVLHKYSTYRLP